MVGATMMAQLVRFAENGNENVETITGMSLVIHAADSLLAGYAEGGTELQGMEIRSAGFGRLAVAVAPFGWAIIHSDESWNQHCTESGDPTANDSVLVVWDQPTSIPRRWFVAKEDAIIGIEQWLTDGSLSARLRWSDQCQ